MYTLDGSWYRAVVQSLEEDGNAKVYFVDYGNTCKVQAAHLKAIKPSLLKHPFQAICCWLAGISCVKCVCIKYRSYTFIVPGQNIWVLHGRFIYCLVKYWPPSA